MNFAEHSDGLEPSTASLPFKLRLSSREGARANRTKTLRVRRPFSRCRSDKRRRGTSARRGGRCPLPGVARLRTVPRRCQQVARPARSVGASSGPQAEEEHARDVTRGRGYLSELRRRFSCRCGAAGCGEMGCDEPARQLQVLVDAVLLRRRLGPISRRRSAACRIALRTCRTRCHVERC